MFTGGDRLTAQTLSSAMTLAKERRFLLHLLAKYAGRCLVCNGKNNQQTDLYDGLDVTVATCVTQVSIS